MSDLMRVDSWWSLLAAKDKLVCLACWDRMKTQRVCRLREFLIAM